MEARIIGVMTFDDGGEVDDKVIAVLADDKRMDHIKSWEDLGEHWKKETTYYWEHYKDLKKPGTCSVNGFFGTEKPLRSSRAARLATWLRSTPRWSTEHVGDRLLIRRGRSPAFFYGSALEHVHQDGAARLGVLGVAAVGTALRGENHVACLGKQSNGLSTLQLTEFKRPKPVLFVEAGVAPPEPPSTLGPGHEAIGPIGQ